MQAAKDAANTMRVMIVDDSIEDAEAVVSTVRNGGVAVRPFRPQSNEEITQIITSQPIDLALVSKSQQFPQTVVEKLIDASGKDIPLIALVGTINDSAMMEAMAGGARAVALKWQPEHLLSVLQAERAELENRRRLRRLEIMLRETERRCDALISSSRDPIAYIHDGMHVRANEAYLTMFGFESFEDVEGMPLLDMVAPQDMESFKQLLKAMAKGEPAPPEYRLHLRQQDGTIFPAKLEFASASYE
ncbi:MAG: PAS domain S-box protein, partial [Xanthomonadaceae bacterium]|nr:PAS domain S-box protein [Xanthomonadaceae bacterium]